MKTRMMMIGIAVAALLLATESVQAQSREIRRERTERSDDRYIREDDPRRTRPEDQRRSPRELPPRPEPRRIKVVDNDVIRSFDRERFDSNRLKMADMVFSTDGFMTTVQIIRVSESFDYDSNRIKFLKKAYLNCVDRHNFYLVLNTVEYSSSREKIISFVIENQEDMILRGEPIRKASSADMNAIIKTLKNETFDSTREKLAKMIVCGSMFTSRQIADMAKTFSFDSNRSHFLEYAYYNCSDPQNYVIAANTLEFSNSRNDLMRKVARRR